MMATAPHTPAPGVAERDLLPALGFAPMPAVARVLAGFQRDQLASFIEVAIGLLDLEDGDPDLEDATDREDDHALSPQAIACGRASGPGCPIGDTGENAWVEWDKLRSAAKAGHNTTLGHEDAEDDDPDHALDEGEPDFSRYKGEGAGCTISDPDFCAAGDDRVFSGATSAYNHVDDLGPGDAEDAEREQMHDDVPMPLVVTLEHNLFNDQRQPLGRSNLQSSFRCGDEGVRSADSGKVFVPRRSVLDIREKPGVPV